MTLLCYEISNGEFSIGNGSTTSGILEGSKYATDLLKIPKFIDSKKIVELSANAFLFCKSILNVRIEARIRKVCYRCFSQCSGIRSVFLPSTLEVIEESSFDDCFALTNVTFEAPYSLRIIGSRGFNTCKNLFEIVIPSTVTSIADDAFTEIDASIIIHYCGRRVFRGKIIDSRSDYKIIVPYGGPKTFGGLSTTYGEAKCSMLDKKATCKCTKQTSLMSYVIMTIIISC